VQNLSTKAQGLFECHQIVPLSVEQDLYLYLEDLSEDLIFTSATIKSLNKKDHRFSKLSKLTVIQNEEHAMIFQRNEDSSNYHSKSLVYLNTKFKAFSNIDMGFLKDYRVIEMNCRFN
jgi:hypothetical protein